MRFFVLICFLITTHFVHAQENTHEIFRNLKNGALLVRLPNYTVAIKAIEEKNLALQKKAEALDTINQKKEYLKLKKTIDNNKSILNKILTERIQNQKKIIDAFSNNFTYCPVFYFNDFDSKRIAGKNFAGLLLDKDLNIIETLPPIHQNYLIAGFSFTRGDSISVKGEKLTLNDKKEVTQKTDTNYIFYNGLRTEALVLFTPDMVMVQRPYPRYAKKYWFVVPRNENDMVLLLQRKIEYFVDSKIKYLY